MSDLYDQVQEIDERVYELESASSTFPVEQEASDAMWLSFNEVKWYFGKVTLVAGTATVAAPQITSGSIGFISANGTPFTYASSTATVAAGYGISCSLGQFTITSSSVSDTSTINYWIIVEQI